VLFDIDGTLLDSNYAHVLAWQRALTACGAAVPAAAVHRCIGMSSDLLLRELVGPEAADDIEERAQELHGRRFAELASELRPLPGARELLAQLAARGVQPVLATSAGPAELPLLLRALAVDELGLLVVAGSDVTCAKPAPDVFQVAMSRAGVDPGHCIAVGDTQWDVTAAARAGIGCIGVLTGGRCAAELSAAGAVQVYPGTAEILNELNTAGRLHPLLI
jgi:HAD superfamily hydrolase (TIGR01509 family)